MKSDCTMTERMMHEMSRPCAITTPDAVHRMMRDAADKAHNHEGTLCRASGTWSKNSVEYLGCAGGSARSAQAASSSGVGHGPRGLEVPIAFFFSDHVGGGENSLRPPRLELYYRVGTTQCCGSICGADQSSWKTGTPSCSHALDPGPQGLGIDVPH